MDVCLQEYLKLSDVYKMYGNGCFSAQTASSAPNAFCLPLAVTPDAPGEVLLLQSFIPDRIMSLLFLLFHFAMPFSLSLLLFSALIMLSELPICSLLFLFLSWCYMLCFASWRAFVSLCFCIPTMPSLYLLCVCMCGPCSDGVKEYVTVSQLNQLFGMPTVDPSPTSPVQSFQAIVADPVVFRHTSQCGSSQPLTIEVCAPLFPGVFWFMLVSFWSGSFRAECENKINWNCLVWFCIDVSFIS